MTEYAALTVGQAPPYGSIKMQSAHTQHL